MRECAQVRASDCAGTYVRVGGRERVHARVSLSLSLSLSLCLSLLVPRPCFPSLSHSLSLLLAGSFSLKRVLLLEMHQLECAGTRWGLPLKGLGFRV